MSNVGRWKPWYDGAVQSIPYGDTRTYQIAADHLDGIAVEDWGCGRGWYRSMHRGPYIGVDGTESPWCDVVDDLATRATTTHGLMMRHVLEHNEDWPAILTNAVRSATERLVIIVFTPDGQGQQIGWTDIIGVPDLALPHDAIDDELAGNGWVFTRETLPTATQYGQETVWLAAA